MRRPPKDVIQSTRSIGRRTLIMGGLQLGVLGAIGFRLRDMQVKQADQYRMLAEENRISIRLIAPARGQIYDRNGAVIAEAGGMLSHSSIVAREYRIPCVVSVTGATRLPDGATVVVDGYTGTVIVENG